MTKEKKANEIKLKRQRRSRAKTHGTSERPRLSVFRSNTALYVQIINDVDGKTIVNASTKEISGKNGSNIATGEKLGELIAKKAKDAGIVKVVFDRGSYRYHGKVKAIAEAARKNGLEF